MEQQTEPKSGVEIHWQSSISTITDANAYLCMNEYGADVFLKPMLKNGLTAAQPKVLLLIFRARL
jgi:hypothetical protein